MFVRAQKGMVMAHSKQRLLSAAGSLLLLFLASCAQTPETLSEINVLADGEALRADAAEYVKDQNVSIDEAVRRLDLQDDIGRLEAELVSGEPDTFGGLWIQHKPEYKVVINMTGGDEKVADYIRGTPFAHEVEVREAARTLKQLETQQRSIINTLRSLSVPSESSINVVMNRVELAVLDSDLLTSALEAAGLLSLLKDISVTEVKGFVKPTVNIYAGNDMACTSGFSVFDGNGLYGISTAGHCNDAYDYYHSTGTVDLRLLAQWYGSSDLQWHRHNSGSHVYKPWARDSSGYREIYDNANRIDQPIGALVCKLGLTTGYTCGYLNSKTVTARDPYDAATYMRTGRDDGKVRSKPGDSGGPVYVGHQAWGLTHGGYYDDPSHPNYGDHVYMATNYITDRGLRVYHAPR